MKKIFKVNLNDVGLESADNAYGGYLDAFSFKETDFESWISSFKSEVLKNMGKNYFPIYRMADGEYRFIMGRVYNFYKKPLWRELIAVTAEKLRIKNPDRWKTSWGEEYKPERVKALRKQLINDVAYISRKGKLACFWNENGLKAFEEYNNKLLPFFKKNNIVFNKYNYIPFHFVCSILVRTGWKDLFKKKHILIVTGSDEFSENKIKETLSLMGVGKVSFYRISKTSSMEEQLNLDSFLERQIDICLVAAGIGSANILRQLEPLQTVVLDIGGYMNCFINNEASQHGGIFKLPLSV